MITRGLLLCERPTTEVKDQAKAPIGFVTTPFEQHMTAHPLGRGSEGQTRWNVSPSAATHSGPSAPALDR